MVVIRDRASRRNNLIPLCRPRIERERDAAGWLVRLPERPLLARRGSSRGAARICRARRDRTVAGMEGRTMTVVRFPREYREPPPPEREQLELWPELPPLGFDQRQEVSQLLAGTTDEVGAAFAHLRVC